MFKIFKNWLTRYLVKSREKPLPSPWRGPYTTARMLTPSELRALRKSAREASEFFKKQYPDVKIHRAKSQ